MIEQAGLERDHDLVVEDGAVVIRPAKKIRDGWENAAAKCRAVGDDMLEDWDSTANNFDGDWVQIDQIRSVDKRQLIKQLDLVLRNAGIGLFSVNTPSSLESIWMAGKYFQ